MSRDSIKAQLIAHYEREAKRARAERDPSYWTFEMDARFLRRRGSGSLPRWAREEAERLGIR